MLTIVLKSRTIEFGTVRCSHEASNMSVMLQNSLVCSMHCTCSCAGSHAAAWTPHKCIPYELLSLRTETVSCRAHAQLQTEFLK